MAYRQSESELSAIPWMFQCDPLSRFLLVQKVLLTCISVLVCYKQFCTLDLQVQDKNKNSIGKSETDAFNKY